MYVHVHMSAGAQRPEMLGSSGAGVEGAVSLLVVGAVDGTQVPFLQSVTQFKECYMMFFASILSRDIFIILY